MAEEDLIGYDDAASVAFIRNYIPQELKELLSDDDIVYFVDLIYDYYESRGYMDADESESDEVIEVDEDELVEYVVKNASSCRANSSIAIVSNSLINGGGIG